MDGFSLFNIGFGELFFILILAGLILGPQRIRQVARWLGKATAQLRGISTQFMSQLNSELDGSEREDLKGALDDIRSLQKELRDLRREVYAGPKAAYEQEKRKFEQGKQAALGVGSNGNGTPPPPENSIGGNTMALPAVVDIDDDPE